MHYEREQDKGEESNRDGEETDTAQTEVTITNGTQSLSRPNRTHSDPPNSHAGRNAFSEEKNKRTLHALKLRGWG